MKLFFLHNSLGTFRLVLVMLGEATLTLERLHPGASRRGLRQTAGFSRALDNEPFVGSRRSTHTKPCKKAKRFTSVHAAIGLLPEPKDGNRNQGGENDGEIFLRLFLSYSPFAKAIERRQPAPPPPEPPTQPTTPVSLEKPTLVDLLAKKLLETDFGQLKLVRGGRR